MMKEEGGWLALVNPLCVDINWLCQPVDAHVVAHSARVAADRADLGEYWVGFRMGWVTVKGFS